ncbi:hypothetical protein NCS56_00151700 [Fusarium sp. Ph1]|nr:hypothetical protein NCS56_00151700 [Fusarium sp. Ph1]
MEAIGVGANVLAFVVLGIKSAKLTHDTLSAISDGPARVRNLAAGLLQLHWILEQLLQCRAAATDTALHGQARQCCETLGKLATTIERLQVSPGERATGRFWKRLKAAISESDLQKLGHWVAHQTSMLSLRLNVLSSNAIYATRDGNEKIQQQIHSFGASMQTQFVTQTATIQGAAQSIMSSHNDGRSALEAGLSSIQETIEATHSISSEDTRAMFELLKEIKDRIAPGPEGDVAMIDARSDDEQATDRATKVLNDEMMERINSLCGLIDEKRDAVDVYAEDDDQVESVIEDLQELVKNIRRQKLPVWDPKSFESGLRRFGRSFGSKVLSINSGIGASRRPVTQVLEQTHSFSEAVVGAGKFSLRVQKRKRAIATEDQDNDDTRSGKRCHTDWMMALAFVPSQGQDRQMLLASITQQELFTGNVSSISQLRVSRVLPAGSPVFELVRVGDLQGFKEMLQNREAFLHDHDEYGASLLFYSVKQPEMCKFLIDSGLDIHHVADDRVCNDWEDDVDLAIMVQVLQLVSSNDQLGKPEEAQRSKGCRELLLRAGADPTFSLGQNSFLERVSTVGTPEAIKFIWNPEFVAPYADFKTYRSRSGMSPLLLKCGSGLNGYTKEDFHQLLQLGANIQDRDEKGRTCLHICIGKAVWSRAQNLYLHEFEAIGYLIQKGADPRAVDKHGRSVSDIAYTTRGGMEARTSYPGDLWDAVLHSCGYDISQFRSGYRRRATYTTSDHADITGLRYDRHDFEELWKGRETECPYWDDQLWPPLEPGEGDSDDESQDHECTCRECLKYYLGVDYEEFESGSELDTEGDEEQTSSDDGSVRGCPHHFHVDQDEEQSESDMGEAMSTGDVQSYWEETDTLPGFGELMQGMPSENWQDSPDLGHSIDGTPRSLSMDLENPWL